MTAIKTGDTVTIRRGKLKGESGKVSTVSGTQIVVELPDGTLSLQNESNLKTAEEATIGVGALAEAFQETAFVFDTDRGGLAALQHLANRLGNDLPGLTIDWPKTTD
jgi:hypothetical protein